MPDFILFGFLGSLAAGLMTAVGALPVLFGRRISPLASDAFLGFAAGVMLAASFFSLLIPSLDAGTEMFGGRTLAATVTVIGFVLGAAFVAWLNAVLPHEHFAQGREGPSATALRRVWLFIIAITIHNAPEGMAVGIGFGGGDWENGLSLAIGIGLQNAPEGLAVALALIGQDYSRRAAFSVAALTGLIEPVAGLFGAAVVGLAAPLLPWGLAFAAGAMIYVISHEIIPETHQRGHQQPATAGLVIGLALMMFLDVTLG